MYPSLLEDKLLRIERRILGQAEILVSPGQRVAADEVIARQRGAVPPIVLDASRTLEVAPSEVIKGLMQDLRTAVKAGEVLISLRAGLRRKELRAPEDGCIVAVDMASGQLSFQPSRDVHEVKAHVSGTVEDFDDVTGVIISTLATRVQGIWGVGDETVGVLNVVVRGRDEDLQPQHFDARSAFAVIVGGRSASAEALKRAAAAGVKAIVLGSIDVGELQRFLEMQGQAVPRWYVGGPDWRLAAPDPVLPFTLVVTEGFGRLAMAPEVFAALQRCEGREASLLGVTRLRGQASRPEIIIPTAARSEGRPQIPEGITLRAGTRVRLIEPRRMSEIGSLRSAPVTMPVGDGALRPLVDVELESGGRRRLPVSSIEVIA